MSRRKTPDIFKKVPPEYHNRIMYYKRVKNNIDGCHFLLRFCNGYGWNNYPIIPCENVDEAIRYVLESDKIQRTDPRKKGAA